VMKRDRILTLFLFLFPLTVCKRAEAADIMFVVHGSSGVTDLQFKNMLQLVEAVVNNSVVGKDNVQFGVLVYSSNPEVQFSLNSYASKSQIREAVFSLKPLSGQPFTARALSFARQTFGVNYGGRASSLAVARILVLITDEPTVPADRDNLPMAIRALKEDKIVLIAVGVSKASREELEEITEDQKRLFFAQSYDALENMHENLTQTVCESSKPGKKRLLNRSPRFFSTECPKQRSLLNILYGHNRRMR